MLVEFGLKPRGEDRLRFDVAALKLLPPADGRPRRAAGAGRPRRRRLGGQHRPDPRRRAAAARALRDRPAAWRSTPTATASCSAPSGRCAPSTRPAPSSGSARCPAPSGRSTSAATAGWRSPPTATARSAGTGWRTAPSCWRSSRCPTSENWVAWTPEGVYAASPGARGVLRWHVNHGWDAAGEAVPVSAIPETHRPEVIPHVLPQLGTAGAIAVAELAKIRDAVQRATGSDVAARRPAARAGDRRQRLRRGRPPPRARLRPPGRPRRRRRAPQLAEQPLRRRCSSASWSTPRRPRRRSSRELAAIARRDAAAATATTSRSILFSGHGEMVDGDKFYLLPHGVDTSSPAAIKATGAARHRVPRRDRRHRAARPGDRVPRRLPLRRRHRAGRPLAARACSRPRTSPSSPPRRPASSRSRTPPGRTAPSPRRCSRRCAGDPDGDGLVRISDLSGYLSRARARR